jgi:hypothetical protein
LADFTTNYEELYQFIKRDGLPMTAAEIEKRVHDYIERQIGDEDLNYYMINILNKSIKIY